MIGLFAQGQSAGNRIGPFIGIRPRNGEELEVPCLVKIAHPVALLTALFAVGFGPKQA